MYDWETVIIGLTGSPEPHSAISLLNSSGTLHLWHPHQPSPATDWEASIDALTSQGARNWITSNASSCTIARRSSWAEQLPLIFMPLSERLTATRNVFGNMAPTEHALWDIRYLYRTGTK